MQFRNLPSGDMNCLLTFAWRTLDLASNLGNAEGSLPKLKLVGVGNSEMVSSRNSLATSPSSSILRLFAYHLRPCNMQNHQERDI
ncbi:unnamed protein product [Linum trigynum]|uniref:Uncharacterized protein n=1 Tax=Linum trigynum TaxID=586398 RepID=A0AAV2FND6_9ROSI